MYRIAFVLLTMLFLSGCIDPALLESTTQSTSTSYYPGYQQTNRYLTPEEIERDRIKISKQLHEQNLANKEANRQRIEYENRRMVEEQLLRRQAEERVRLEHEAQAARVARDNAQAQRDIIEQENRRVTAEIEARRLAHEQEAMRVRQAEQAILEQQRLAAEQQAVLEQQRLAEQLAAEQQRVLSQQQAAREERLRQSEARSLERSRARIEREAAERAELPAVQIDQPIDPQIHGVIPGGPNPGG